MKKQFSNIDLVQAINRLSAFVDKDKVVPVQISYAISKNMKTIKDALEPYELERQKLLKNTKLSHDTQSKKFKELCDINVEIDIHTVPTEVVEDIEQLTTKDYLALEIMIE